MESTDRPAPRSRYVVQLSAEDAAWLTEQATDEGVEPGTLLRMLVTRLRQGRPALYRQALEQPRRRQDVVGINNFPLPPPIPLADSRARVWPPPDIADQGPASLPPQTTEDLKADPVGSLDAIAAEFSPPEPMEANGSPAIPLHAVSRDRYNPVRK